MEFIEIHVPNTVTDEWELLTFDFTDTKCFIDK
jgi:hypothetical protein